MLAAEEDRVGERERSRSACRRVERRTAKGGCLRNPGVPGLQHEPSVIHAAYGMGDLRGMESDMGTAIDLLDEAARRGENAGAAENDVTGYAFLLRHGDSAMEAARAHELVLHEVFECGQVRRRLRIV